MGTPPEIGYHRLFLKPFFAEMLEIYLKGDTIIEVNWGLLYPESNEYAMKWGSGDYSSYL